MTLLQALAGSAAAACLVGAAWRVLAGLFRPELPDDWLSAAVDAAARTRRRRELRAQRRAAKAQKYTRGARG